MAHSFPTRRSSDLLVLAGFVGFAVISKVPNTLHTPLMSGTNAIHGIVVLGALIVLGNLPATMPEHASELYAKNVTALLELLITDGPHPCLAPDFDDEVVAASCVTRETASAGEPTTPGVS